MTQTKDENSKVTRSVCNLVGWVSLGGTLFAQALMIKPNNIHNLVYVEVPERLALVATMNKLPSKLISLQRVDLLQDSKALRAYRHFNM